MKAELLVWITSILLKAKYKRQMMHGHQYITRHLERKREKREKIKCKNNR